MLTVVRKDVARWALRISKCNNTALFSMAVLAQGLLGRLVWGPEVARWVAEKRTTQPLEVRLHREKQCMLPRIR